MLFLPPPIVVCAMLMVLLNSHKLRAEEVLHQITVYLNIAKIGC